MRINKFLALATGVSRREADKLIQGCKVFINELPAQLSDHVTSVDVVKVDKKRVYLPLEYTTIILNKPVGYVTSRNGQGSKTIYDLLPKELHHLKPVGRLDKDSSGLLLMTDNGDLAHELTHPKFLKPKVYEVTLDKPLKVHDFELLDNGVKLTDGLSRMTVRPAKNAKEYTVSMTEGRNRQIRRTFSALGYKVINLHRTHFGSHTLDSLLIGEYSKVR